MNALEVYRIAECAGIQMVAEGDRLRLRAHRRPPTEVLEAVRQHKAGLITFLAGQKKKSPDDAGAEDEPPHLDQFSIDPNRELPVSGRCAWCGQNETASSVVVPFGTQTHSWLHPDCWPAWYALHVHRTPEGRKGLNIPMSTPQSGGSDAELERTAKHDDATTEGV